MGCGAKLGSAPVDHLGDALTLLLGQGLAVGLEGGPDNSDLRPVAARFCCLPRCLLCQTHEAHLQGAPAQAVKSSSRTGEREEDRTLERADDGTQDVRRLMDGSTWAGGAQRTSGCVKQAAGTDRWFST